MGIRLAMGANLGNVKQIDVSSRQGLHDATMIPRVYFSKTSVRNPLAKIAILDSIGPVHAVRIGSCCCTEWLSRTDFASAAV